MHRRGRPARQRREDCVHSAKPRVASSGSAQHALATAAGGVFHVVRSSSCVTPPAAMVKPSLRHPQEDPLRIRLPFCVKKRSRSDSIRARRRVLERTSPGSRAIATGARLPVDWRNGLNAGGAGD